MGSDAVQFFRRIEKADLLIDRFMQQTNGFQETGSELDWKLFDDIVWDYCSTVQEIHMTTYGTNARLFDQTISVLQRFVNVGEVFIEEFPEHHNEASSSSISKLKGVVERCNARIVRLEKKKKLSELLNQFSPLLE